MTTCMHTKIKRCSGRMRVRIVLICCLLCAPVAFAAVMESDSYRMSADSVNIGGAFGESDSYHMEDTVGEIATGDSESASYRLHAGYQQMHGSMISVTPGSDVTLDALSMAQNSAVASTFWVVTTDNTAGYTFSVRASSVPALIDGGTNESFTDYTDGGSPESWNVTGAYEFGFSGYGESVETATWGTDIGPDCIETPNVPSAGLNWLGFEGTNDILLASSEYRTDEVGESAVMCVATQQNGVFAPSGTYIATVTATAVAQ